MPDGVDLWVVEGNVEALSLVSWRLESDALFALHG